MKQDQQIIEDQWAISDRKSMFAIKKKFLPFIHGRYKLLLAWFLMTWILLILSCKKEYSCEDCGGNQPGMGENKPPLARTGPDQVITLPVDSTILDGSGSSDPDGAIASFSWLKIYGPLSYTISALSDGMVVVKNLVVGIYQFELTVTDNGGKQARDTIRVQVDNPQINQPPVAHAGPDQVIILPATTTNLDGRGSWDTGNNIVSYEWTKIAGPSSFILSNANAAQTQVSNLVQGVYQFELKVTDAGSLFSRDTMRLDVADASNCNLQADWEIIITLPIDSVYIDDYYRDTEGICVQFMCGTGNYIINGAWVKNLVPGVYYFRRYWIDCVTPAEIVKVSVINDPGERNTITYKNMRWEYSGALDPNSPFHLFLPRPFWPTIVNLQAEVLLQMDTLNNGQWFPVPSNTAGYSFWLDSRFSFNVLQYFIVRINPENAGWNGRKANLKIRII